MAQNSQHTIQPYTIWTLDKGLFNDRHEIDIPPQGCQQVNNLIFLDGFLRPRSGYVEAFPTGDSTPCYHVSQYTPLTGTPQVMRATIDGSGDVRVYRYTASWAQIGTIPGGNTSGIAADSVNFNGEWLFCPGDEDLHFYDGTLFDNVDTRQSDPLLQPPAKPRLIAANDARVFVADVIDSDPGVGRVPYRIAWCDTLNVNVWGGGFGAGSSAVVDLAGESDPITALYATSDIIIVFKPRTIYIGNFVGPPQFYAFRRLVRGPGCISNATLKEYRDGLLVWLGDDNVYVGLPGQRPQPIANAIEDRIREVVRLSDISKARAVLDRDNHLYTLYFPILSDGRVVKTFTCNLLNFSWWEGELQNPELDVLDGFTYRSGPWTETRLVATQSGKLFDKRIDTFQDAGVDFPTDFITTTFSYERLTQGRTQQSDVQLVRVHATPAVAPLGTSGVDFAIRWGNSLDRFIEKPLGRQVVDGVDKLYVPFRQTSEHFKIRMSNDVARDHPFVVGLGVGIVAEGDTRYFR